MPKTILLSTIGSRGDVQPLVALAVELRKSGHHPKFCLPPNFKDWIESLGFEFAPIGIDVQKYVTTKTSPKPADQMRQMVHASVIDQFNVTMKAAEGCNRIVVANGVHHGGRSVAEALNIPFVFVTYCTATLKSPSHVPPNVGMILRAPGRVQTWPKCINRLLWRISDRHSNNLFRDIVNQQRERLDLRPVEDVPAHIATDEPWVAADALLAPLPPKTTAVQTGAWILPDPRPLPDSLEKFLNEGEPPVYFGFGSMRGIESLNRSAIETARALGYRAVVSTGWSGFQLPDNRSDCMAIDDISFEKLFPRVAAVVHHGGAGTTTAAARSGKPQVIVPHMYDQFYFAHRIAKLGIGVSAGNASSCSRERLTAALKVCLRAETRKAAESVGRRIELNGARIAADRLMNSLRAL